jgi:hypothetical protein
MNEQQTLPPHVRLKELMSIPDNQKTEAQWDELIELEIALAQGGRMGGGNGQKAPQQAGPGNKNPNKPHGGGGGGSGQPRKPARKFHKKPAKPAVPGS